MNLEEINKRTIEINDRLDDIFFEKHEIAVSKETEEKKGELYNKIEEERASLAYELFVTLKNEAENKGFVKDYYSNENYVLWKKA